MTKRSRNRVRSRGKLVLNSYNRMVAFFAYGQASSKWEDWNFRTISLRSAEIRVGDGEAERITRQVDGVVEIVGFRATKPSGSQRPSPTTLTEDTMHAVAGDGDNQHKWDAFLQARRERAEIEKFLLWPFIGDDRAVCVRPLLPPSEVLALLPRLTSIERKCAEKMLAAGRLRAA